MLDQSVKGLIEAQKNIEQAAADLHGQPFVDAMKQAALLVEGDAKRLAPVDTGHLRASITSEVRVGGSQGKDVIGVIGSNVKYAPYMELGTKPHFPPPAALAVWARRHGLNAFVVARSIAAKGLKARRYLQGSFEKNQAKVEQILDAGVHKITKKANNE